jgi:hypothetical protein
MVNVSMRCGNEGLKKPDAASFDMDTMEEGEVFFMNMGPDNGPAEETKVRTILSQHLGLEPAREVRTEIVDIERELLETGGLGKFTKENLDIPWRN